jgi:hypothetical protein
MLWFDGTGWSPTYTQHPASLGAPGSPRTQWSLRWTPPPGGGGSYAVTVQAIDTAGTRDPSQAWAGFSVTAG